MKKLFLILVVTLVANAAMAQKGGEYKNVIKINPLGFIFGIGSAGFERVISNNASVQFNLLGGGISYTGNKYTNIGAGVDFRYYFSNEKMAPVGFYGSVGAGVLHTSLKTTSDKGSATGLILKAVVGNQWVIGSGFTVEANAGIQYVNVSPKVNGVAYDKFNGVLPALGFSIGYAFQ